MTQTILVLSEEALTGPDLRNLQTLRGEDELVEIVVLIPEDAGESVLGEFFRHLSLLEVGEAFRTFSSDDRRHDEAAAREALEVSLQLLADGGFTARGRTTSENPVDAMIEEAAEN